MKQNDYDLQLKAEDHKRNIMSVPCLIRNEVIMIYEEFPTCYARFQVE